MTSQFEYLDASYVVLVNDAGQRSLWPGFADAPDCWRVVFGKAGREEYLSFIEESRHDMRPKSLIEAMGNKGAATGGTSA